MNISPPELRLVLTLSPSLDFSDTAAQLFRAGPWLSKGPRRWTPSGA